MPEETIEQVRLKLIDTQLQLIQAQAFILQHQREALLKAMEAAKDDG